MHFNRVHCGHRIRLSRKAAGLTQLELSTQLHISEKYLSRIETGRQTASIDLLVDIAIVLNVSIDVLVLGYTIGSNSSLLGMKEKLSVIIDGLNQIVNEIT